MGVKWSKFEDEYLIEYSKILNINELMFKLFNRSKKSIYNRISYLKLSNQNTKWDTLLFKKHIYDITNGEYEVLTEYVNTRTKIQIKHNKCGNLYNVSPNKFLIGRRCPKCSKIKITPEVIKHRVSKINNGEFMLVGEYNGKENLIEIHHKICNKNFLVKPNNFLLRKRCHCCFKQKTPQKSHIIFLNEIKNKYNDEYLILEEYRNSGEKVLVKHKYCGNEWQITPTNLLRGFGCPVCCNPKGEKIVHNFLKLNNIKFTPQFSFDDCRGVNGGLLKFDFAIFKNDKIFMLIEIQGKQHYEPIEHFGGKDYFEIQKIHDNLKKDYCNHNYIKFLEISYKQFGNIEKILKERVVEK